MLNEDITYQQSYDRVLEMARNMWLKRQQNMTMGVEEGLQQGVRLGNGQFLNSAVFKMLTADCELNFIAEITELPMDQLHQLHMIWDMGTVTFRKSLIIYLI